jgi:phosphatidate cytidylyltransferase
MKTDGLSARLCSAAVILVALFTLMWLDYRQVLFGTPGAWLLPLLLVVAVLGAEEVLSLLAAQQHRPVAAVVYAGCVLMPLVASWPIVLSVFGAAKSAAGSPQTVMYVTPALGLVVAAVFLGEMARYEKPGTAILNAALGIFAIVYLGVCLCFWVMLRLHRDNGVGMVALFSMLLIVKIADVGAFTFGKLFGRTKLTPVLSPGKTWEGAIGGVLTACVASWAFFGFAAPMIAGSGWVKPSLAAVLGYGVALALAGMIGDLAESLLKRDMQRKDSSTWLPGLGGVLDIIDAPLIAGPVAWLWWNFGLLGN